jgi:hypothetical protein
MPTHHAQTRLRFAEAAATATTDAELDRASVQALVHSELEKAAQLEQIAALIERMIASNGSPAGMNPQSDNCPLCHCKRKLCKCSFFLQSGEDV